MTMQSPVQIDVRSVSLKTTFPLILRQLGLGYVIKDGLLIITSDPDMRSHPDDPYFVIGHCALACLAAAIGSLLAPLVAVPRRQVAALGGLALAACLLGTDVRAQSSAPIDLFPPALFAPLPAPRVPDSDLAVVFWFDTRDPLGTLRHQAYDRRTGEYTPAVDEWLRIVRHDYPHYTATVRYINVGRRTPDDAVRKALVDERAALAAVVLDAHSVIGSTRGPARAGSVTHRPPTVQYRIRGFGAPGAGGIAPNPSASYSFPVPMPYPRPHP